MGFALGVKSIYYPSLHFRLNLFVFGFSGLMLLQKFKLSLLFALLVALCLGPVHAATAAPSALEAVQDVDAAYQAAPAPEEGASKSLFHPKTNAKKKSSKKHSKDFYDAHKSAPKDAHKSAPKKAKPAAVQADDLMNAMRKGIDPTAPPDAPMLVPAPATTTAPIAPAIAAQQPMQPIPSEKLFHPVSKDEATAELPPVTPKGGATVPVTAPVAPPDPVPAPVPAAATPPPVVQETKKEEPKKEEAKTGAPLLSDLNEAPEGAVDVKADEALAPAPSAKAPEPARAPVAPTASHIEAEAEPVKEAAKAEAMPEGFAKSRSLFSAAGDTKKRPGISHHKPAMAEPAPSPAPSEKAIEPHAALPPVAPPPPGVAPAASTEPMIKPVGEAIAESPKKSIWGAPTPEMSKGKVIFSQSADGTVVKAPAEPASTAGEVISTEEASSDKDVAQESKPEEKEEKKPQVKSETPADASAEAMNEATVNEGAPKEETTDTAKAPAASAAASAGHRVTTSAYNPAAGGVVHGSCGAVNGVGLAAKPASNLCTQGTASAVTGTKGNGGPWNWTCNGSNGGSTVKCSASVQVNGECGPANGSLSASPPPNKLCASGKATSITGSGPWYWSCFGDNGGVTAQCVVYTLVSGACGPANHIATGSAPTTGLCKSGHETAVIGDGPWSWSCTGSGENTTVSCTAPVLKEGACGEANGIGAASMPHSGLCASGNASAVSGTNGNGGPWNWKCTGENGGASVSCFAPVLLNAACGAAHGVGVAVAPAENLCGSGTASAVSGTQGNDGPWNWTCNGENGGAMADCMAPKKLDGVCGAAHQAGSSDAPITGLCNSGMPSAVAGTGPWQWSCQGAGGGITTTCVSQPLVHAGCGSAHGVSVTAPPTDHLCATGTPTSVIGSGPFMWSCQGANGGSAINCMAPLQVNGACGSADGVPVNIAPTGNLCRSGTASAVSGNGPYAWTCSGAGGGISTTCQAPIITAMPDPVPPPAATAPAPEVHVPEATAKAGNECTPSVKRWTITCQQGGYPSNYTGVIVGETQTLCPTGVERGVWLSNSCAAATDSAPVSPSPGKLETPASNHKVTDVLPHIAPMPAKQLDAPKKLYTPRYKQAPSATATEDMTTISFASTSEALDSSATNALDGVMNELNGNDKSIVTLNAYAATPADGDQQESRRMALARALAVRSYLMRKGLASNRIDVRAVGPASDNRGDDRVDIKVK